MKKDFPEFLEMTNGKVCFTTKEIIVTLHIYRCFVYIFPLLNLCQ